MRWLKAWIRWQDRLSEILGRVIAWMCFAIVCILMFEVISRQFLDSPTTWAHESSTLMYGTYAILAGFYTEKWQGHVRTDIIYQHFPPRLKALVSMLIGIAVITLLLVVLKGAVDFAWMSFEIREQSFRSTWAPIIWPVKLMIPVAIILIILQMLASIGRHLCAVLGAPMDEPKHDPEIPHA
ncbi:TRAP transporter small permease subunit [Halomonas sp. PR-M31]|uniref:TRAP transporter small permease subunit n=1 Tax=Halomonas sp. PR-M31 TaxID=1471202 RepID=UPI0006509050|nr:TRAP transporter small permease subunit [Halomonas sp. PR-M31]